MTTNNSFTVIKFIGDLYGENSYLCINNETNEAMIIDPGTLAVHNHLINNPELKLVAVLLTHGHSDHILCTDFYVKTYQVPLYIHEKDAWKLLDATGNLSTWGTPFIVESTPMTLKNKTGHLTIASFNITYQLAAGHSEGQVIYHLTDTNMYFVGDTVFEDSIGRYDLPGANAKAHYDTLMWIERLPAESKLYAGHGRIFLQKALATNAVFQAFKNQGI